MKKLILMLLFVTTNCNAQQVNFTRTSSIITNVTTLYHNITYNDDTFGLTNFLYQNEDTITDGVTDGTDVLNTMYVKEFTYKNKLYYLLIIDKTIYSYTIYVRNKPIQVNTYNKKYCYILGKKNYLKLFSKSKDESVVLSDVIEYDENIKLTIENSLEDTFKHIKNPYVEEEDFMHTSAELHNGIVTLTPPYFGYPIYKKLVYKMSIKEFNKLKIR